METSMNTLIHFIQKKYNEKYHSEILEEAYRLLNIEKEQIMNSYNAGQELYSENSHQYYQETFIDSNEAGI